MITALIPARAGSKRIPNKNMKKLDGKPLFDYSVAAAQSCDLIDEVWVSSDSEEILDISIVCNASIHYRLPDAATETATDADVLTDFFRDGLHRPVQDGDLIVYLRPTTPFRRLVWIEDAIKQFQAAKYPSSLRSVEEMSESADKCFKMNNHGQLYTMRDKADVDFANQPNDFYDKTYRGNGAVDIIRADRFLETGQLYGFNCMGYLTPPTVEIDTPEDWAYAEYKIAMAGGGMNVFLYP